VDFAVAGQTLHGNFGFSQATNAAGAKVMKVTASQVSLAWVMELLIS